LAWIDQNNVVEPLFDSLDLYYMPRVSPDGSRLVVTVLEEGLYGLWVMDLDRKTMSRLTLEANSMGAIWSPDSRRLAYASSSAQSQGLGIFVRDVEITGPGELVTPEYSEQVPTSWSPDGETLLFTRVGASGSEDIFALSLANGEEPLPLVNTKFNESGAVFSPNGNWIAYSSTESGIYQVYLRPYPGPGPRIPVSPAEPAFMPVWSRDGGALYFIGGHESQRLMRVEIGPQDPPQVSAPRQVLERRFGGSIGFALSRYDVSADGERFVFATPEETWAPTQINLVQNWFEELELLATRPAD
jgi:Tol biopolymer transport system component